MDRNGVLKIVRGARDVAKFRGDLNIGSSATQNNGRSRVRGQLGVVVRRDDNNGPLPAYESRYDQDDEHENETLAADSGDDTRGPRTAGAQRAGIQPPPDAEGYGTVDLSRDSTEKRGGERHRVADVGSSPRVRSAQSLRSWLQPAPSPKAAAAAKGGGRRRKRPLQETESAELPRGTRTWATTSSQREKRATGDGSLAAWLEPRQPTASRKGRSTPGRSGTFDLAVGHGSSEHSDSGREDDDSGRWMSDRLEGLDPSGAARAKDGWTDRERRNLTATDVALGAKRKGRGGGRRGWRTKAGGSKVSVAPGRGGGAVESDRQAVSGLFRGGGGGDGRKKRRR